MLDRIPDKICVMDTEEIQKRLEMIIRDANAALSLLAEMEPVFPKSREKLLNERKCLKCGLPLDGDKCRRGLHG